MDWRELVEGLSEVQTKVHLAARMSPDDVTSWASQNLAAYRREFTTALENEASEWGCAGRRASWGDPEVESFFSDAAGRSADSIANTYNYFLAREIAAIGEATPTANRHVYAHRLFYAPDSWSNRYWSDKTPQIATTETYGAVGVSKDVFYRRNGWLSELVAQVEVRPYDTVCPVCATAVAGNPYASRRALVEEMGLPPYHVNCPHYESITGERRLTREECEQLWMG